MHSEKCEYCKGSGVLPIIGANKAKRCIACGGKGRIEQEEEEMDDNNEE